MTRVLLVDDSQDWLATMGGTLRDAEYEVVTALNEGQAMDEALKGAFDYALVDVRLHGDDELDESGSSLALALRVLNPAIQVILLTHYLRDAQISRALRFLGAMEFVEKTPDVGRRVLEILARSDVVPGASGFRPTGAVTDTLDTELALSLVPGQPISIRSRGRCVRSARSWRVFQAQVDRYALRAEVARQDCSHQRFQVAEIGRELWGNLFGDYPEVLEAYRQACAASSQVSLVFETSSDGLRLPLEFLRAERPTQYLALQHPLHRFLWDAIPRREALSPRFLARASRSAPLRVLIIASSTKPPIEGVDCETAELFAMLSREPYVSFVRPTLITTAEATLERVSAELGSPDYDIVHYAGHGRYVAASPEDSEILFWIKENCQGEVAPMRATELSHLLMRSSARLVYFSSCWGTASGDDASLLEDDFLGLADAVAQAGVPSVLGFRWPVSDSGAQLLAQEFYKSLLDSGSPEIALWRARQELAARNRNDSTWMSPILIHQV